MSFQENKQIAAQSFNDAVNISNKKLPARLLINSLAAVGLSEFLQTELNTLHIFTWQFLMASVILFQIADHIYWRINLGKDTFNFDGSFLRIRIGCFAMAFCWTVYTMLFFYALNPLEFATMVIIISALASGAATLMATDKLIAMLYPSILLVPVSLIGVMSEQANHNVLGVLGFGFVIVMLSTAKTSADYIRVAIASKYTNLSLIDDLEQKNEEIASVNQGLERKIEERTKHIYQLSNIDPLTQLLNRKAFSAVLNESLKEIPIQKQVMAILFIDLDGFKTVNDLNGHEVGDRVLMLCGERLRSVVDEHHHICRWGGDEFIFAIYDIDEKRAIQIAEAIIYTLSSPIKYGLDQLKIGATIGIAHHGKDSYKIEELIAFADSAMYQQKRREKSKACTFNKTLLSEVNREIRLKDALFEAVKKGELRIVYQPIIKSGENKAAVLEALLRWSFEEQEVSPDKFIEVAERHGQIHSLGRWVLFQACRDAANWMTFSKTHVSVNISVVQLMQKGLVELVECALKETGLPAEMLHIEITESTFAEDIKLAISVLEALHQMGINISIDDFGKGFSSLSILNKLPTGTVKIDKVFVHQFTQGGKVVIEATQHIAKSLGYNIIVEGVETKEQLEQLTEMGISYFQGFYFSKPKPLTEMKLWL